MASYIYVNSADVENLTRNADHSFNTRIQNIKNDHPNTVTISIISLDVELSNAIIYGVVLRYDGGVLNTVAVDNKASCLSICVNKTLINTTYGFSASGEQPKLKIPSDALTNMKFHFEDYVGSTISQDNINFAFVLKVESTEPVNAMALK